MHSKQQFSNLFKQNRMNFLQDNKESINNEFTNCINNFQPFIKGEMNNEILTQSKRVDDFGIFSGKKKYVYTKTLCSPKLRENQEDIVLNQLKKYVKDNKSSFGNNKIELERRWLSEADIEMRMEFKD